MICRTCVWTRTLCDELSLDDKFDDVVRLVKVVCDVTHCFNVAPGSHITRLKRPRIRLHTDRIHCAIEYLNIILFENELYLKIILYSDF